MVRDKAKDGARLQTAPTDGRRKHREGRARSGSGDPELQARGRSTHGEGQAKDGARLQTAPTDLGPLGPTCL